MERWRDKQLENKTSMQIFDMSIFTAFGGITVHVVKAGKISHITQLLYKCLIF